MDNQPPWLDRKPYLRHHEAIQFWAKWFWALFMHDIRVLSVMLAEKKNFSPQFNYSPKLGRTRAMASACQYHAPFSCYMQSFLDDTSLKDSRPIDLHLSERNCSERNRWFCGFSYNTIRLGQNDNQETRCLIWKMEDGEWVRVGCGSTHARLLTSYTEDILHSSRYRSFHPANCSYFQPAPTHTVNMKELYIAKG
jgi:hypothetical protein